MTNGQNTFTYYEEEYGEPVPWLPGHRPKRPVAMSQSGIKISIFTWGGPEGHQWFEFVDTTTDYKRRFYFEELYKEGSQMKFVVIEDYLGRIPQDIKDILSVAIEGWLYFGKERPLKVIFSK